MQAVNNVMWIYLNIVYYHTSEWTLQICTLILEILQVSSLELMVLVAIIQLLSVVFKLIQLLQGTLIVLYQYIDYYINKM